MLEVKETKRNGDRRASLGHGQWARAAGTLTTNSPTHGQTVLLLYQCLNAASPILPILPCCSVLPALLASLGPAVINCFKREQSRECYPQDVDWLRQNRLHHLPPKVAAPVHRVQLVLLNTKGGGKSRLTLLPLLLLTEKYLPNGAVQPGSPLPAVRRGAH